MFALGLIPRAALLAIIALLLVAAGFQTVRLSGARAELAEFRAEVEAGKLADSEAARMRERKINAVRQEATSEVRSKRDAAAAAAAGAAIAGSGLRQRAEAVAIRCAGPDPASGSPPAEDPARVLSDVLGRVEAAGRRMAEIAGERGIAGEACERISDAVTAP